MRFEQPVQYASLSDIGFRRQNNQDACGVLLCPDRETWKNRGHLFVVADGMGGHAVGELASKIAVETILHTFYKSATPDPRQALREAMEEANRQINTRGTQNPEFQRMGTTGTALVLGPDGVLIGHVGDSRIYRVRGQRIDQLSADHSLVWEMIQSRQIHPRDAGTLVPKNIITRSLGPEPVVKVDLEGPHPVLVDDVYLLCSDGLSNLLEDGEIGMIAQTLPASEACRFLVNLANLRGGLDNITVVIARVGTPPDLAESVALPTPTLTWRTFLGLTAAAGLLLGGIGLLASESWRVAGIVSFGLGIITGLMTWLFRYRPPRMIPAMLDPQSTVAWRPYRTASAAITPAFLNRVSKMLSDLHKAALDEGWAFDAAACDACTQRGEQAMRERRPAAALREFAKAYDVLMQGVHEQRRQLQRQARWGRAKP